MSHISVSSQILLVSFVIAIGIRFCIPLNCMHNFSSIKSIFNLSKSQPLKMNPIISSIAFLLVASTAAYAIQAPESSQNTTSTSVTQKLFTYTGPLLPSDWSLVSILNDRAVIGFKNGTARNSPLDEFDVKDKTFLQRLQNGTVYSTPLSSAKEKIAQWSSSVSSTVTKLGKSVREQFDTLINNNKKEPSALNATLPVL